MQNNTKGGLATRTIRDIENKSRHKKKSQSRDIYDIYVWMDGSSNEVESNRPINIELIYFGHQHIVIIFSVCVLIIISNAYFAHFKSENVQIVHIFGIFISNSKRKRYLTLHLIWSNATNHPYRCKWTKIKLCFGFSLQCAPSRKNGFCQVLHTAWIQCVFFFLQNYQQH